jgi:mannose-1-phosphate guanylyltransferase/phosphomannomutase
VKAVVMAGGQGARLRPLTCNRPKPLVPICNRPMMEYVVDLLKRHGVTNLIVTLHYLADEVMTYFGDGTDWGVQITYSIEADPLGTAGSIKKVQPYLDSTFLVLSGDAFTDIDLTRVIEFHRAKQAVATIALARVESPLEFGVVITDDTGRVERFLEKPTWSEVFSDTVNTGIYVLEPELLDQMESDRPYDFSQDLFPAAMDRGKAIYGCVVDGYWCDVGNLQQYRQAQLDLLEGRVQHQPPGEFVSDKIWMGQGCQIHPSAYIEGPVVVGKNCRIRENARLSSFTVLGDDCVIEEGAQLQRDVLWSDVYVGKNTRLAGSIVGRHTTLKNNVSVGDGVVLGDAVFVGTGAILQPKVKVWPDKNIEAGANVSLSLIWGKRWPGSLFGLEGIAGLGNIEITPEFALKLGAAFGASLEKGSVITSSRDSHPAARMTNRALMCGLISVGCNVRDLRITPAPISRTVLKNSTAAGGIHTRVSPEDPRSLQIEFYDERGINIDKGMERRIENRFFREDFRRTTMDEVGHIDFPARTLERYLEGFAASMDVDQVRKAGFRVVIDYCYGKASVALPSILGQLGCETVSLNAYLDPQKATEVQPRRSLEALSNIVMTLKADMGVLMDTDVEKLVVVDETGRILSGSELLAAFSMMVFRHTPGSLVAAPIQATSVLEKLARDYDGRVIRTRTDTRSLMHTASVGQRRIQLAGTPTGGFIFPGFSPGFDAMFAFARLLELLAGEQVPLSEVVAQVPSVHVLEESVPCTWQQKGRVMRLLIEENREAELQMLEGVKIIRGDSWALVLPDPTQPQLQLWAEGPTPELSRELLTSYHDAVVRLQSSISGEVDANERPSPVDLAMEPPLDDSLLPEDRAFHFWTPGRYLGVRARSYREFVDTLLYIEPGSLAYHLERGDFSNWVENELKDTGLAERIRALDAQSSGEDLRSELLRLFPFAEARS